MGLSEFQASLVYRTPSRTDKATQRNPVGRGGGWERQNGDKVNKATRPRKNAYQVKALTLAGRFSYLLWYFQSYAYRVASLTNRCSHGPARAASLELPGSLMSVNPLCVQCSLQT